MLNTRPRSEQSNLAKSVPDFWNLLTLFWDEERVDNWKRTIFPDPENPYTGVERCFNLISLAANVHDLWNNGMFALKPLELSADRTQLRVQFFWQPSGNFKIEDRVDLLAEPTSSQGLETAGDEDLTFARHEGGTFRHIRSGDIFIFTTKDPVRLPLPSVELLEMQWHLQRLVRMCGAATWPRLDLNDDSDDIIPGADGNAYTADVYKWIPPPPPNYGPNVAEDVPLGIPTRMGGYSRVECR